MHIEYSPANTLWGIFYSFVPIKKPHFAMNTIASPRFWTLAGMIILAVLSRVLPHPDNFSPIAAVALFGAAYFAEKRWAYIVPMLAMIISDAIIGFHALSGVVYGCFALMVALAVPQFNKGVNPLRWTGFALAGSLLFFLITNFAVWAFDPYQMYPRTWAGFVTCYTLALPFLKNSIMGDLFYTTVLFGSFELLQRGVAALRA